MAGRRPARHTRRPISTNEELAWRALNPALLVFGGFHLGHLKYESEGAEDVAGRGDDFCSADDRRDRREYTADLVLADPELGSGSAKVHHVRGWRRIDGDEGGDADQHGRVRVEC